MSTLQEAYQICLKKFDKHMTCLDMEHLYEYRGSKDGHYEQGQMGQTLANFWNWMTSFVTGMAPLFYRTEKKAEYLAWANKCKKGYHDKMFETPLEAMHDIGFLYSPYSVAMYQLTGDPGHRADALQAADVLLKRFNINGKYISAWDRMDEEEEEHWMIIDCMMNIQLLFWAWKESGHNAYRDVAKAHMDSTIKYFVRDDYSVCHAFKMDPKTGEVLHENNSCGYANGSHWARGTGWMVYGLAYAAGHLQDTYYSELAEKILGKYLEGLYQGSYVPVWDFRLPADMPAFQCGQKDNPEWDVADPANCVYNVDTSAAAIIACAMIQLDRFSGEKKYHKAVEDTLTELCEKYFNEDPDTLGMIHHQDGGMWYATYGDYYFAQALQQFLYDTESCW